MMFEKELNLTQYLLIQNRHWDLLLNKPYTNTIGDAMNV